MSLAIFPSATSFTTAETDDTAMLDDAQVLPVGDMDMSPGRDPIHSFTATASMEWGAPSQPQLPMGDLSMATDGAFDSSMYGELGPVDMEMTAEYDMTIDDDIQHQNYEMHMADAALIAPVSIGSVVPLAAGHVYSAGVVETTYPVPTPVVAIESGLPALAPLHTPTTDVAHVPLYSPHDTADPASAAISEFYAPAVVPAGPETEVASEPAPPAADPPHEEPVAAVAEPSALSEPETTVEHAVEPIDQVQAPVEPVDEQYQTSQADPAQEPEPDTAHVTEVVPQPEEYPQYEQEVAPRAESAQPQKETYEENVPSEPYALEAPTLGIPPILLSILFSPTSSPTQSPHLPAIQPLYSLFSKPDLSNLPSSSLQPGSPEVYLLLADRPQLFFENIATLLQALRGELLELEEGGFKKDMFEFMEMILYARQLDLTLPEDNIHAQLISLYDFAALHQSCAVPGYLHLDLKLQVRFKSRWDEIKRAVSEQEKEYEAEGYNEHEQAAPNEGGREPLPEQARSPTVNEEQVQGTTARTPDSQQPEPTEPAPASAAPHQSQQQQPPTDDQPSFDLSEFVGFEEPPLEDDDDNWDDDDNTARVADTTANTFISLAHTEVPAQTNEDEAQEAQEEYTNSRLFSEGEGVSAEYGEYEEGEWGHEEGATVEQVEAPATGQVVGQGHNGTIEAGDEVAQYDGEEYIGPEYEYVYNETEDVEGEVGEWVGDVAQGQLNVVTEPEPTAAVDYSQDISTQQDHVSMQTTQDSAATATTISLHHLPVPPLLPQQEHEQPEGETQEPEEYYDAEDVNTQEYYGNYGEGDAEEGEGTLEHPIDLTAVEGADDQLAGEQQVRSDPVAYPGDQDVDEVSTLEGSPSQDDQLALLEADAEGQLVDDEDAGADPVLVDVQAGVARQRHASGHKRRHEDVEADDNEEGFGSDVKRARLG